MAHVIAIAGPIGAGKSSLVEALARQLPATLRIHFDQFERGSRRSMEELREWLDAGGDFDAFEAPGLAEEIHRLKHPIREGTAPTYILFEMPLGREYKPTAALIDLLLWVDTPLDLALARRMREYLIQANHAPTPDQQRHSLAWISTYLDNYMEVVHAILALQAARVRPNADCLLDGTLAPPELCASAMAAILERCPA